MEEFHNIRPGKRSLRAYRDQGAVCICLYEELVARSEEGTVQTLTECTSHLQVGAKLLVKSAVFTIKHELAARAVYFKLRGHNVFRILEGPKKILVLNSETISDLEVNSDDSDAKTFMALFKKYATVDRVDHESLKFGNRGITALCMDLLDICTDHKYEFEIAIFALDNILRLFESEGKKFDKKVIAPQFLDRKSVV